jgi:hypothetical protein
MGAELLINIKQRFLSTLRMTKEELEEKAKTSAYGKLLGVTGLADPHWYVYVSLSQDDRVFQFYDAQMSLRASMTVSPDLIPIWINTLDQLENS